MMRILCVIPQMGPGGAERVMASLVNSFSLRNTVGLITWETPGTTPFYPLLESVQVKQTGLNGTQCFVRARRRIARFVVLRQHVQAWRPDVVLSFLDTTNLTTLVACLGVDVPVVVSERVDPARRAASPLLNFARNLSYRKAARIIVQTQRAARYFSGRLSKRIVILPNPIGDSPRLASPDVPGVNGRFLLIGVGRLEHQKGFDRLIEAFAEVAPRHPLWDLRLFGEGSQRAMLSAHIDLLGLGKRVQLAGVKSSIHEELANAHLFAFPSRYEGFPNALAEAMSAGLPVIGYDQVSGVEEMILHNNTGYLLSTDAAVPALVNALDFGMENSKWRRLIGDNARRFSKRWAPEIVLKQWEAVMEEVVRGVEARSVV